jgi:hypothetical protein
VKPPRSGGLGQGGVQRRIEEGVDDGLVHMVVVYFCFLLDWYVHMSV